MTEPCARNSRYPQLHRKTRKGLLVLYYGPLTLDFAPNWSGSVSDYVLRHVIGAVIDRCYGRVSPSASQRVQGRSGPRKWLGSPQSEFQGDSLKSYP